MKKTTQFNHKAPIAVEDCGMAKAAKLLGDKWSLLILREAFYGVARFDDIRIDIGIPKAVLTKRLSNLVAAGLLTKQSYQEPGQRKRNAYVLTDAGKDLALPMIALMQWGDKHFNRETPSLVLRSNKDSKRLIVGLVEADAAQEDLSLVSFSQNTSLNHWSLLW